MELRPYQQESVSAVMESVEAGERPCVMLPTGAGKSLVLAELCRVFVERGLRVLMLTHVRELVEQNSKELQNLYREMTGGRAPLGIYSAGLKKKQLGRLITYASVQSIAGKIATMSGEFDVVIVDECHLISTKGVGRYNQVRDALPNAIWIGLTATPWRLGHGQITEGEGALFDRLLTPAGTSVRELVDAGYLAPLFSKPTDVHLLDLVGEVTKRGGDYVESELAKAIDLEEPNEKIAAEIVSRGQERDHWLLFCVSVRHATRMAELLTKLGAPCGVVHGAMSPLARDDTFTRYRLGELRALANVGVLSTGWNFPNLDLIAFLRPTDSPVLYAQQGGRGLRLKTGRNSNCLVLDFADLVSTHGPITDVRPPRMPGEKRGEVPVKKCPVCSEIVLISCMVCHDCGHEWELPKPKKPVLHTNDIMGERKDGVGYVTAWTWWPHVSLAGKKSLAVEYKFSGRTTPATKGNDTGKAGAVGKASEYFTVWAGGDSGDWAREKLKKIAEKAGVQVTGNTPELIERLNQAPPPSTVKLTIKNGWVRVGWHKWDAATPDTRATEVDLAVD